MPKKYAERYMCRICGNVHGSSAAAKSCYDGHDEWERERARGNGFI